MNHMMPKHTALGDALTCIRPRCSAGNPVTPHEHNWVIQLIASKKGRSYLCGASLIDAEWVMTAAHCTDGIKASNMKAHVHRHRINGGDGHECAETLNVDEKFEYDEYDAETFANDIALLRLSQVHQPLCHALRSSLFDTRPPLRRRPTADLVSPTLFTRPTPIACTGT